MTTLEWIQELLGQRLQPLVLAITNLGSDYAYIAFLTLYYWLIDPWTGRQLGLFLGISYGFNTILKELFDMPRPFELNPDIASADAIATGENASFPSGHVQGSATFWIYLSLHHRRIWLWMWSLIILSLIAISRLYLGVHFPIDVIAGLIVGILFAGIGKVWSIPVKPRFIVRVTVVILTTYWRYSMLTLFATEIVPRVLHRQSKL